MLRQITNLEILEELTVYFFNNPDIRFWQGLWNLGIVNGTMHNDSMIIEDKHYEEPEVTLNNIRKINEEKFRT